MSADKVQATYKSRDTEEWLDIHFTRPIGYLWARFFQRLNVHPNVVTVFSIFLGIGAGVMFAYRDILHNVAGVLLLMWANFYDSCDGQLARMTGKKTQWGRMLDGFAGDVWFVAIYLAIIVRLFNQEMPFLHRPWGLWIFALCVLSGIVFHARQCQLADYYRNIHLYFLPGAASELDSSVRQRQILAETPRKGNFWWRAFLASYVRYTRTQERLTPNFQKLIGYIHTEMGDRIPDRFRQDFRRKSLPLMKYANMVTFNCRAITLYIACLIDMPWLYPVVEIVLFTAVADYMKYRHETMCKAFYERLRSGGYREED